MAETAIPTQPRQQRSPLERYVDKVWRFFTSVRNAIYEISFLTLLVLIGTLRASSAPQWMADHLPFMQPLVDRWYAWDVFRSPLFAITLAVIAIAIIICTLNRIPKIWATFAHPKIRTSMGFINGADTAATYSLPSDQADPLGKLKEVLAKRRYRVLTEQIGSDTHVYADKNRFSGFGTFPFHIGLILLLVGGIVASSLGFRDNEFYIAEGYRESVGHGTGLNVELLRVTDTWNAQGSPIDYTSNIAVYEGGDTVKTGDVQVNSPLSYRSATFYQSAFGNTAEITVRNASGSIVFAGPVFLGRYQAAGNPDAPADTLSIPLEGVSFQVIAPDNDAGSMPALDTLKLAPGEVWIGLTGESGGAVLEQGKATQVGDYMVTFEREGRFSVLQVGYNPAIPIFLIAAGFLVGGLIVTFYFPHRRIRGILKTNDAGSELSLAPLAKRDYSGKREFYEILSKLNVLTNTTPTVREPGNKGDYEYLYKQSNAEEKIAVD